MNAEVLRAAQDPAALDTHALSRRPAAAAARAWVWARARVEYVDG